MSREGSSTDYRLLKDGQFLAQAGVATEMGLEIHAVIETLSRHGFEFVPTRTVRPSYSELIASLTFKPFIYEEELPWEDAQHMSITAETRERICTGAVLKIKGGDIYFVGDCNELLGICDDCRYFTYEDIVEIAYLWGNSEDDE